MDLLCEVSSLGLGARVPHGAQTVGVTSAPEINDLISLSLLQIFPEVVVEESRRANFWSVIDENCFCHRALGAASCHVISFPAENVGAFEAAHEA